MPRGIPNNPKTAKKRGRKSTPAKKTTAEKAALHEYYILVGQDCTTMETFHDSVGGSSKNGSKPTMDFARCEAADVIGPILARTRSEAFELARDTLSDKYEIDNGVLSIIDMTAGSVSKCRIAVAFTVIDA